MVDGMVGAPRTSPLELPHASPQISSGGHGYKQQSVMNTALPANLISAHAFQYQPGRRVVDPALWQEHGAHGLRPSSEMVSLTRLHPQLSIDGISSAWCAAAPPSHRASL